MFHEKTVFVVDDDDQARDSVCALIRSMGLSAESFPSAEAFLAACHDGLHGCLVTDLRMFGMSGIELQEELIKREITLPVIVITAYPRTSLTVRAMKHGAITLLEKPYADDDLWDAVREAIRIDETQREEKIRRQSVQRKLDSLSEKERDVMNLMVQGMANKVIASKLDVSIRTVEARRHDVFEKMEASSLAELVRMDVQSQSQEDNQP